MGKTTKESSVSVADTKKLKKELKLPVSAGKLRKSLPPGQRVARKALEIVAAYIKFNLELLADAQKQATEDGKHLLSPQMCADIFNANRQNGLRNAGVFPNTVAGFNNESRPPVVHRKKKNEPADESDEDKEQEKDK